MIDEKEVAFMRKNPGYGGDHIGDLLDAIEALLKIARAAQEHVRWVVSENPNTSVEKLREALALLPPSDEGEKK